MKSNASFITQEGDDVLRELRRSADRMSQQKEERKKSEEQHAGLMLVNLCDFISFFDEIQKKMLTHSEFLISPCGKMELERVEELVQLSQACLSASDTERVFYYIGAYLDKKLPNDWRRPIFSNPPPPNLLTEAVNWYKRIFSSLPQPEINSNFYSYSFIKIFMQQLMLEKNHAMRNFVEMHIQERASKTLSLEFEKFKFKDEGYVYYNLDKAIKGFQLFSNESIVCRESEGFNILTQEVGCKGRK